MQPKDFYWAIVLKIWPTEPVFHAPNFDRYGSWTRCGRPVSVHTPWLPMKHVVKFARPCKGCFDV